MISNPRYTPSVHFGQVGGRPCARTRAQLNPRSTMPDAGTLPAGRAEGRL